MKRLSWSPSGERLAAGTLDGWIRIWDVATQNELAATRFKGELSRIHWSPAGNRIVYVSREKRKYDQGTYDKDIPRVWNLTEAGEAQELLLDGTSVGSTEHLHSICWSRDGDYLAGVSSDAIVVWGGTTGHEIARLSDHAKSVKHIEWSPTKKRLLASASEDLSVRIWDLGNYKEPTRLKTRAYSRSSRLSWSQDGRHIAVCGSDDATLYLNIRYTDSLKLQHYEFDYGKWSPGAKYLAARGDGEMRIIAGEGGKTLYCMPGKYSGWSPNGHMLYVGDERITRFIDFETRKEVASLKLGADQVWKWRSDARQFVSCSWLGSRLRVWDLDARRCKASLVGNRIIQQVEWSPNGRWIACRGYDDNKVHVWDSFSGRKVARLKAEGDYVNDIKWAPAGEHLAAGGTYLHVWSFKETSPSGIWRMVPFKHSVDAREVCVCREAEGITKLAWMDGGRRIVFQAFRVLCIVNVVSGECVRRYPGRLDVEAIATETNEYGLQAIGEWTELRVANLRTNFSVAWYAYDLDKCTRSPDGSSVWAGVHDDSLQVIRLERELVLFPKAQTGDAPPTCNSSHAAEAASGASGLVASSPQAGLTFRGIVERKRASHSNGVWAISLSPDGKFAVFGGNGSFQLWDLVFGQCVKHYPHSSPVGVLAISPDGRMVAAPSYVPEHDGFTQVIQVFELLGGNKLHELPGHDSSIQGLVFSPDSRRLLSGSWDGTVRYWDVSTAQELRCFRVGEEYQQVMSVAMTRDGRRAVAGVLNDGIWVWDLDTEALIRKMPAVRLSTRCVAVSPDGVHIVAGQWQNGEDSLTVWEIDTGRPVLSLEGVADDVNGAAFTPDGRHIFGGGDDCVLALWDASTGKKLCSAEHGDSVNSVAVSPCGRYGLTGSNDRTARWWSFELSDPVPRQHDGPVLRFPCDFAAGTLKIRNALKPYDSRREWEPLARARGKVLVTRDHEVSLDLSEEGARDMSFLRHAPDHIIARLGFLNSGITDEGLGQINELRGLKELDLVATGIGDSGLAAVGLIEDLVVLSIGHCPVTDHGLNHLRALRNLCSLDIQSTRVTDSGVRSLLYLASLEILIIYGTGITETGCQQLRNRLPNCTIYGP